MPKLATTLKSASKLVVFLVGATLAYLNDHMDIVPVAWRGYVTFAIMLATALGIYQAPHGALPSLTGFRSSEKRTATRKRHPSAHKTTDVAHPKATHPAAAVKPHVVPPKDAG